MTVGCKLRQSTASQVVILGPFLSSTDGTPATGLSIANTDIILIKRGSTTSTTKNSGGATHITGGLYYATFDATDSDTLGGLVVVVEKSGAMALRQDLEVLPAVIFDSWILGTDLLQVDLTQIGGSAVATGTAQLGVNVVNWKGSAAAAMTGDAYARLGAPAGASVSADIAALPTDADVNAACDTAISDAALATASALAAVAGYIDTEVAAILADTNELQTDLTNGGRLDLLIDGIKAKTDTIAAAPTVEAIADQVWDELLSGHTGAGSAGNALSTASSGGVDPSVLADAIWDEALSGHATAGTAGKALTDTLEDTGTTLDGKINTIDTILDNIHDTDLPAVKSDTGAISTVVDLIPTLAEIEASTVLAKGANLITVDEIHDEVVEGTLTLRQAIRIMLAALAGKATGGGTTAIAFRDIADTKDRISATVDSDGNRTAITRDGT